MIWNDSSPPSTKRLHAGNGKGRRGGRLVVRYNGAPIECRFGQNLDNFLTNVQVLSRFCPIFVQVLSMSNNCQNNLNFTKFCLIFVNILSNIFVNCPRFVWRLLLCPRFLYIWQNLDKKMSTFCPSFVNKMFGSSNKIVCLNFVNILSMSNFCPTFV